MDKAWAAELNRLRPYLLAKFHEWVCQQRDSYWAEARPLSSEEKSQLAGYFEDRLLNSVRVASVDRIQNPEFYKVLRKSGVPVPLDFSTAVGLTLIDCILMRKELRPGTLAFMSTLFHEMVHVVQFDILGVRGHIELYADSLRDGDYQYHSVILERQAYALTDRFDRSESPFSVSEVIRRELGCRM